MRTLGIALLAALALGAFGASAASAAKDPYTVNTWTQYAGCPWEKYATHEITDCFYGRTAGGKEGGEFKYGHFSVKLNQPVVIQGGFRGGGQEVEVEPATHGAETLESGDETIVGGLKVITPALQNETEWPTALKESFAAAKKNKETSKATLKIVMVGDECFTVPGCLSTENILFEEGTAFRLPLKVVIKNAWLESLGGGPCQIGSDEHPIMQHLTSSGAGYADEVFNNNEEFTNLELHGSQLVDTSWHIEPESGANGCGGSEYESYIDAALNKALEVQYPWKTGITWLKGDLHDAAASVVSEKGEKGEL